MHIPASILPRSNSASFPSAMIQYKKQQHCFPNLVHCHPNLPKYSARSSLFLKSPAAARPESCVNIISIGMVRYPSVKQWAIQTNIDSKVSSPGAENDRVHGKYLSRLIHVVDLVIYVCVRVCVCVCVCVCFRTFSVTLYCFPSELVAEWHTTPRLSPDIHLPFY
jgi:hypothetical protein